MNHLFSLQPIRVFTHSLIFTATNQKLHMGSCDMTWFHSRQPGRKEVGSKAAAQFPCSGLFAMLLSSKAQKELFNWQGIRTRWEIIYILVTAFGHKVKSTSISWFGSTSLVLRLSCDIAALIPKNSSSIDKAPEQGGSSFLCYSVSGHRAKSPNMSWYGSTSLELLSQAGSKEYSGKPF